MGFPGTGKIWMNGKLVDWADAKIHVASHVVHYGSAVFEGARCYETLQGPACFRLDAHMRRLYDSARIYRMEIPYDQQTLTDIFKTNGRDLGPAIATVLRNRDGFAVSRPDISARAARGPPGLPPTVLRSAGPRGA